MTTTTTTGIRAARVSLGNSLACSTDASADDLREAEQQFQKALSVPEDVPPTWEIMAALARLARDRQLNAPAALKWMVSAVRAAGDEVQSGLIREALKLLDDHDAPALLDSLPAEHLDWLREAAGHSAADPVLQLATRVALIQGRVGAAGSLVRSRSDSSMGLDSAIDSATVSADVIERILVGDLTAAGAVIDAHPDMRDDPAMAVADALLSYARGEEDLAIRRVSGHKARGDLASVIVVSHLRIAAGARRDDRAAAQETAMSFAIKASRQDPVGPTPLLLRAQVLLEEGEDLDKGRSLLRTAVKRLGGRPEDLMWWRVQDRYRGDDDFYNYYRIEVDAVRERWAEVRERARRITFAGTTYAQDAAVRNHWAQSVKNDPDEAAQLLRAAAIDYQRSNDDANALQCLRRAQEFSPGPETALELAEAMWRLSFTDEDPERGLQEAIDLMSRWDDSQPEESLADACLLWGLLLSRRLTLRTRHAGGALPPAARWEPLPHLILAALLRPQASYSKAHLAEALGDADLYWPALRSALAATHLRAEDDWLQYVAVMAAVNWYGTVDDGVRKRMERLREAPEYAAWSIAVLAYIELLDDVPPKSESLEELVDSPLRREFEVYITMRDQGFAAARPLIAALLDESVSAGNVVASAWFASLLDPHRAVPFIDAAANEGWCDRTRAASLRGLAELIESGGRLGLPELLAEARRETRPYRLRSTAYLEHRLVRAAYGHSPELLEALDTLQSCALDRLQSLESDPPLTVEVSSREAWCLDADLEGLVVGLLHCLERQLQGLPVEKPPSVPGEDTREGSTSLRRGCQHLVASTQDLEVAE